GRFLRFSVADQLDAKHEAHPADLADQGVTLLEFEQTGLQMGADASAILLDTLGVDDLERRQSLGHRDGIATKGGEVDTACHRSGDLGAGDARSECDAVAHPLGHRHEVGDHAPVLESPEMLARAAEARLHLVSDAESTMFADDLIGNREVLSWRRYH